MEEEDIPGASSGQNEFKTPEIGMHFSSLYEVLQFCKSYARRVGFDTAGLCSKDKDGQLKSITIRCSRGNNATGSKFNCGSSGNAWCQAKINVEVLNDEVLVITGLHLEHNHDLSPGKSIYSEKNSYLIKKKKKLNPHKVRILEINDEGGIGDSSARNEFKTPEVGMYFSSVHEVRQFYESYARRAGFDTNRMWTKKGDDGQLKFIAFRCTRYTLSHGCFGDTRCQARLNVRALNDEVLVITGRHLEHNHDLSPGMSICNEELNPQIKKEKRKLKKSRKKRKSEINDEGGIGLIKTFQKPRGSFIISESNSYKKRKLEIDDQGYMRKTTQLSAQTKLQTVFEGNYDEMCSVNAFRDSLDCEEIPTLPHRYRVFWYPENATPLFSRPPSNSIQQKIKDFLLKLGSSIPNYWIMHDLVQFWAPDTTESGRTILSVTKQPFGVRENLKGLCRYRYYCCSDGKTKECGDFGPVGRAFTRGSPEFCPDIVVYEDEDFPVKNAKTCGIEGYLALPVFKLGQQSPVGVLEFVSLTKHCLSSNDIRICIDTLKEVGLAIRYPSNSVLTQIWPYFHFPPLEDTDEIRSVLDLVKKVYNLPLIQVWLPCICDGAEVSIECDPHSVSFSKVSHMVCHLNCLDRDGMQSDWLSSYAYCDPRVYFVRGGESWIGRAHLLKKICFVKDITQYSIMEYPLITLGHSSNLSACFAVPLQLLNPMLPPLVLEVFLSAQYDYDAYQGAILKPLLSMVAQKLSKYNGGVRSRHVEDPSIEISHSSDDCDCAYFDVYCLLPVKEEDYVQPSDATEIEENARPSIAPCREPLGQCTLNLRQTPEFPAIPGGVHDELEPGNDEVDYGAKNTETENSEAGHGACFPENVEVDVDQSCTLIVKASYKDDKVRFPFSSNSGIEGLRRDLLKRFELEGQRIKIKYQEGEEWIMLSCSDDLSFYMCTLKSSGQTTMDVSVFSTI